MSDIWSRCLTFVDERPTIYSPFYLRRLLLDPFS